LVDFKKIKGEMEVHDTFIETFKQKYEITEQGQITDEKGIKAYTDFLSQEVEIELNLIEQDVIDQVNLKPVNIIMLEELGLIKQDKQDEELTKK
jgi:regulator of RNase E activity RraB